MTLEKAIETLRATTEADERDFPLELEDAMRLGIEIMVRASTWERFWSKVSVTPSCWEWTGTLVDGYGQFWNGNKLVQAHQYSYEIFIGRVPEGLQLDHLCRNRACVQPSHLEAVTLQENIRRGQTGTLNSANALKTHCLHGHPFNDKNTILRSQGGRDCRICHQEQDRRNKMKRKLLPGETTE